MNDSKDKPILEVYPCYLVVLLSIFWGCLWFALWVGLRGTLAAIALLRDPYQGHDILPWLVPAQLLAWLVLMYFVQRQIRHEKSPPAWMTILCLLLPLTYAPTAVKMLANYGKTLDFKPDITATFGTAHYLLQSNFSYIGSIVLAVIIGLGGNRLALRKKYKGLAPGHPNHIVWAWLAGGAIGIGITHLFGTMWGFLALPVLGNVIAIHSYRQQISKGVGVSP